MKKIFSKMIQQKTLLSFVTTEGVVKSSERAYKVVQLLMAM